MKPILLALLVLTACEKNPFDNSVDSGVVLDAGKPSSEVLVTPEPTAVIPSSEEVDAGTTGIAPLIGEDVDAGSLLPKKRKSKKQ